MCLCAPVPEIRAADWRGAGVPGVRCRVGPSSGRTVGSRVYTAAGRTLSLPSPTLEPAGGLDLVQCSVVPDGERVALLACLGSIQVVSGWERNSETVLLRSVQVGGV